MNDLFTLALTFSNGCKNSTYFSDWVKSYLLAHGIDTYVFNPGASFRGLHDSLAMDDYNEIIMTCHEEIAVSFAHGYYKASGKIICVVIHANVGLLHSSMAIFNAWCDRVPLLCLVGNGPLDAAKRRPWIDWIHTAHDILAPIRGYTSFSSVSTDQWGIANDIKRAIRIAVSESHLGPAVVALDSYLQETHTEPKVINLGLADIKKKRIELQSEELIRISKLLSQAKKPLFIIERAGRQKGIMNALINLSKCLGYDIPVIECGYYENAITINNENLWFRVETVIFDEYPDLIITLDTIDPLGYLSSIIDINLLSETVFININTPGLFPSGWSSDTGIDPPGSIYNCDIVHFLNKLSQIIPTTNKKIENYLRHKTLTSSKLSMIIKKIYFTLEKNNIDYRIVNGGSNETDKIIRHTFNFKSESQFLGMNGGGGLGYGLPASMGAAFSIFKYTPETLSIAFLGDGDFMYTPSSLWTASAKKIPLLIIIVNNGEYSNSLTHAQDIAHKRSRSTSPRIATTFDESTIDFEKLAQSFSIESSSVDGNDLKILSEKVKKAIRFINKTNKSYILNVKV